MLTKPPSGAEKSTTPLLSTILQRLGSQQPMIVKRITGVSTISPNSYVVLLFLLIFLYTFLWSLMIPFDAAPDEAHRYATVLFFSKHCKVPTFGPSGDLYIYSSPGTRNGYVNEGHAVSPIGAHLFAASLMRLIPLNDPAGLLHSARLASVISLGLAAYFVYKTVWMIFNSREYALAVAAFAALIPQFTYTGGYVNDDAFQAMAVTWYMWSTIRGIQRGWSLRSSLLSGLALVAVSLGKQNGWFVVIPFSLLATWSVWREGGSGWLRRWLIMYLPASLTLGSWLLRNDLLYGDPLALGILRNAWYYYVELLGLQWAPPVHSGQNFWSLLTQTDWLTLTFQSFWGRFSYMDVPMNAGIYLILLGGCVCGAVCTTYTLLRRKIVLSEVTVKILICMLISFVLLFVASTATSLYNDYQPQGRYFFPVIAPIVLFLTLGFDTLVRLYFPRLTVPAWMAVLTLLLLLNIFALTRYIVGYPHPHIPLPNF